MQFSFFAFLIPSFLIEKTSIFANYRTWVLFYFLHLLAFEQFVQSISQKRGKMKMRHLYLSFSIIAMASTFAMAATITPATPKQDADDCYMISSPEELYGFAAMVNGDGDKEPKQDICGKLTKDITINTNVLKTAAGKSNVSEKGMYTGDTSKLISWVPMGSSEKPFLGSFRGQGNNY